MSELSGPADRGLMRLSDADRDRAAEVLREAAAQGRLGMDELDERLELAYAAKTFADLEPVTGDLPKPGSALSTPGTTVPAGRLGGTPRNRFSIAIMSGARRKGRWVLPRSYVAVAIMGGVELDLREASFSEPEVTVCAYTLMGGIQITVPDDIEVDVSGFACMGGFDHHASGPGVPGAPRVRVIGCAVMGGVEVKRKPPRQRPRDSIEGGPEDAIER